MPTPKTVTVVQARSGSSRLPGKIFLPLAGAPLLVRMVERVKLARLVGNVVVATTTEAADDPTAEMCRQYGLCCFRGHPTDLLDRHYQCAREFGAEIVLKIPSDCPLIDPTIVDRVIARFLEGGLDYVSNLHPATYPDGQDVEVMAMSAFEVAWREAHRDFEREHTTPFFWENAGRFRIGNVEWENGQDWSMSHRITIDYPEDYDLIRQIYTALYRSNPRFGLKDIVELWQRQPELLAINSKYAGVNWYRHHLDKLTTIRPTQTKTL